MRHHQLLPRPQHGDPEVPALPLDEYTKSPSQRIGGWSGEKQATFLRAIAEGATVGQACRLVGLTQQSAYAFRLSARGAHFALGWEAALLHARNCLADTLMERALHGTVETITRSDGSEVERHRIDNRLGMAMLTRLDRMADKAAKEATHAAARLVAQEFEAYIDLVARDAGPARADSHRPSGNAALLITSSAPSITSPASARIRGSSSRAMVRPSGWNAVTNVA